MEQDFVTLPGSLALLAAVINGGLSFYFWRRAEIDRHWREQEMEAMNQVLDEWRCAAEVAQARERVLSEAVSVMARSGSPLPPDLDAKLDAAERMVRSRHNDRRKGG